MADDIDELIEMASSGKVREFRKHTKPVYKYMLCGILHDIIVHGNFAPRNSYGQAKMMAAAPSLMTNKYGEGYVIIKRRVIDDLKSSYFYDPERDSQVDMIISFLRTYLKSYKEMGKTLYMISEVSHLLDIKNLVMHLHGIDLKDHHWIDINFNAPIIPTFPEFFNYMDLINLWNDLIDKYNRVIAMQLKGHDNKHNPLWRELEYSYYGSLRAVVILAVNFVESYLYYYFYNCKKENRYPKNKVFNLKGYIQDTQVVEDLIFEEHKYIKDDSRAQELYALYENVLKVRDRLVHTSAFVDKTRKVAELQPLLNLELNGVTNYLQNCIDLVSLFDSMLPKNEKILFWWDQFETPNFKVKKKISVLSKNRN